MYKQQHCFKYQLQALHDESLSSMQAELDKLAAQITAAESDMQQRDATITELQARFESLQTQHSELGANTSKYHS